AWEIAANRGWTSDGVVDFQRRRQSWRAELLRVIRSFAISRADRIIVPSRYVASMVRGWGIQQDRLSLIYNAVEPPEEVRAAAIPLEGRIKVVAVSRLIACKQLDLLIEAVSRLDGVGLLIVGDGPERPRLEELSRRFGLGGRVGFVGAKSKSETLQLIAGCDIFALASTHEGFPHAVLEAMSLGVPVVATAVGGTVEIVRDGENGRLVGPTDHGGLLRALSELASAPAERRRLAAAAKGSLAAFSYRGMLEATEAVLSQGAESTAARSHDLLST
ncbi:MAG: glycosyltransferase, partial [Candidatus Binatia bacterium]